VRSCYISIFDLRRATYNQPQCLSLRSKHLAVLETGPTVAAGARTKSRVHSAPAAVGTELSIQPVTGFGMMEIILF
jgi:hypothetical protein